MAAFMAEAPSWGAGTVRKEPLNYEETSARTQHKHIGYLKEIQRTFAVGVRAALRM
jgi:hypothetical protein